MSIQPNQSKFGYRRKAFVGMLLKDPRKRRPPRYKDEEVFNEVRVKNRSLRQAAATFGISHTQVRRVVERYGKWLGDSVGRGNTGDWLQRKGVAEHVHRHRLELFFSKSLEGLDRSFQDIMTRKFTTVEGKAQFKDGNVRQTQGNWRWLDLALQAEAMRINFEFNSGAAQPTPEEEVTDEENKEAVRKYVEDEVYFDRPPTEEELEDARTVNSRLEEERKLLEEERRMLAIERAEIAKLKRELESALAEVKRMQSSVGRVSLPVGDGEGRPTAEMTALANGEQQTGRETRPTGGKGKEKPRAQFKWRFAEREDFSYVVRRQQARQKIREMEELKGFCPPFTSGPPLEVKKGVYIVAEPYPTHDEDKVRYRAEWQRQEEEAKTAGKQWREPREKFREDGSVVSG